MSTTRRRIIDGEIAQQKAENDTRVHNAADPPKADRNGKHAGPRKRPSCSRCGDTKFITWGYDQDTGALVCFACYLVERPPWEPKMPPSADRAAKIEPQPTACTQLPTLDSGQFGNKV